MLNQRGTEKSLQPSMPSYDKSADIAAFRAAATVAYELALIS